ncbi:MAG: L,D-transpeptidase family protein, partial [Desulfobacterales bacterium]
MSIRPNILSKKKADKRKPVAYGVSITVVLAFLTIYLLTHFSEESEGVLLATPAPSTIAETPVPQNKDDGLWDGPILYHATGSEPIHLILIEKDLQVLHLYRYDGHYQKVKTYRCVTGKLRGDKQIENDDKTPEGIYFNVKTFRDKKVTIFGDRAFGLNYPDAFDAFEGKGGSGIFVHGTNRKVTSYSTNGCLVLNNQDLADLDSRITFSETPVIIGKRLPYRFAPTQRDLATVIPVIKQVMLPEKHAAAKADYRQFVLMGYQDQMVASGKVWINTPRGVGGVARVYLADPTESLLVLLKREWDEDPRMVATAKPEPSRDDGKAKEAIEGLVASWRNAWSAEQLDAYISHYHPAFSDKGRTLSDWKRYKKRLNNRYRKITVTVSNLKIRVLDPKAYAYFRQHYKTESYDSRGYKRLEFRQKDGVWKIFRERSYPSKPSG